MSWRDIFSRLFKGAEKSYQPFSSLTSSSGVVSQQNLIANNKNWVFVAVDRISSAASGVRFKVMRYKQNGDDEELFDGDVYNFMQKPHPMLTWLDFTYLDFAYKELAGNAFWEVVGDGKDRQLIPLIPTRVRPVYENGILIGYKYQDGIKQRNIVPDRMLHDKFPSPESPFWGVGPLFRIADWVETDAFATEFNRLFFVNGASFGGFIETEEESKDRIELIKLGMAQNHSGVKNSHKLGVLPKNAKFKAASQTMRDMQFSELDDRYRDKILAAFGVPKTLAGLVTEVNRASAEASEYIFAKYVIEPKIKRYVEFLNKSVVPLFDKTKQIYIDYEEFVPEDREMAIKENQAALGNQSYMTINEVRADKGLPPISGGDVVYGTPFGAPIGSPQIDKDVQVVNERSVIDLLAEKAVDIAIPAIDKDAVAYKAFSERVEQYEKILAEKIVGFNEKQKNEVLQKLVRITKAVSKTDLWDQEYEVGVMVNFVEPILRLILTEQAAQEFMDQGFEGELDISAISVAEIVAREAKRMAKSYNNTTAELLKTALNEGIKQGEGVPELTKRIQEIYEFSDSYRAKMTAQTESFYIANKANSEAYKQSGVVKSIRWWTSEDERVCEFCGPMHGKSIGVKEVFFKKGDTYEGRDGGKLKLDYRTIDVPPIHPNCRCFIRPDEIEVTLAVEDEDIIKTLETLLNEA